MNMRLFSYWYEDVFLCEEINMYQTKQKRQLIDFFKNNNRKPFLMNEIISAVCPDGKGKSTIYRIISQLTDAGELIKMQDDSKSILYQYVGEGTDCCSHFHLKCSECGNLIHLDCEHIDKISQHIFDEHDFILDMKKTVFYGICRDCSIRKEI